MTWNSQTRPVFISPAETEPTPVRPPLPAVIQDIIDDHNELLAWLKELGY